MQYISSICHIYFGIVLFRKGFYGSVKNIRALFYAICLSVRWKLCPLPEIWSSDQKGFIFAMRFVYSTSEAFSITSRSSWSSSMTFTKNSFFTFGCCHICRHLLMWSTHDYEDRVRYWLTIAVGESQPIIEKVFMVTSRPKSKVYYCFFKSSGISFTVIYTFIILKICLLLVKQLLLFYRTPLR